MMKYEDLVKKNALLRIIKGHLEVCSKCQVATLKADEDGKIPADPNALCYEGQHWASELRKMNGKLC